MSPVVVRRVLVTGGSGFLGQAVVRRVLAGGAEVDVLTSSNRPSSVVAPGAGVVRADLRDRAAIDRVIREGRYDGVCHLAALARARDSLSDPVGYFDVNVTGTLNLLHGLEEHRRGGGSADPARLVFISTGAVYGPGAGALSEDQPPVPANPYGWSKLAAEQVIGHQAAAGRLAAISLRCFNIAGAVLDAGPTGIDRDLTRIIPKTLAVAAGQAEQLEINGDGSAVREYTHVLDVAEAVALALAAAVDRAHRIYNVGSGQGSAWPKSSVPRAGSPAGPLPPSTCRRSRKRNS